jgi:hypothetical protein
VECHEVWHYDDATHVQTLRGLKALCPSCHQATHPEVARNRGRHRFSKVLRHLSKTNGWSREYAEEQVGRCLALRETRGRHEWSLDVRWLNHALPKLTLAPVASGRRRA